VSLLKRFTIILSRSVRFNLISTLKTSEYKTSGILESYLLGLVSDAEKQEVEQMIVTHPELNLYIEELGMKLESQFLQGIVPPPPNLRELVELRIDQKSLKRYEEPYERRRQGPSTDSDADRMNYVDVQVSNTHIQVHKYWRVAFIAVFVLSKIFLAFGLYYYFKAQSQDQEIERLNRQIQQQTISTAPR
jgi:hypothetical protein